MSIQTVVISSIVRNRKAVDDETASAPFTDSATKTAGNVAQITVVLDGVIYDAEVRPETGSTESPELDFGHVTLQDGVYILSMSPYDAPGSQTTLHTNLAEAIVVSTMTVQEHTAVDFSDQKLQSVLDYTPNVLNPVINTKHYSLLAEPRSAWISQSTRRQSSKRATMTVCNSGGRIILPSSIVLTPRVMLGVLGKMPTNQIEETVEALLLVLDRRSGDPDLEVDADFEIEVDEEDIQPV